MIERQTKSVDKRINEFVRYHLAGDGECNNVVLKRYCDRKKMSLQERYELAVLFSITYCVESAIVLFDALSEGRISEYKDIKAKPEIIFQSDRKYMRMGESYKRCLNDFLTNNRDAKQFIGAVTRNGMLDLPNAVRYVSKWVMFGRFSAFLLLETFAYLTGIGIINATIDWKKGDTATSGLLNVYGKDDEARTFDKTGKLLVSPATMDKMLADLLKYIANVGGETNVTVVETSLCAYRKFYKGTRYNGYYLDRMLGEIVSMSERFPVLSDELIEIRKEAFDSKFLGEVGGWNGIRKPMNRYYIETGNINDL